MTSSEEGGLSTIVLGIDIDARMSQEDGNNGVVAALTGLVKGRAAVLPDIPPINVEGGITPEHLLHLIHLALLNRNIKRGGIQGKRIKEGHVFRMCDQCRGSHREI